MNIYICGWLSRFSRQFRVIFFLLLICHFILQLHSEHRKPNTNNKCPHLFKTLHDCSCVRPNTIDCSSSTTLTHLPRSWTSTNHNLTAFTQSITHFNLSLISSLSFIKTNDFQVENNSFFSFLTSSFFFLRVYIISDMF